jgi:hypothetical protein
MQPLSPSNLQFAKHASHEKQRVILPSGVPAEWLKDPFFWTHVAKRLVPFDEVQIIPEDGSWIAEYYVVQTGENWARLVLSSKTQLESVAIEDEHIPKDYEIKFQGPVVGWSVLRKGERLYPGTNDKKPASRLDAIQWLKNNTRTLAA